MRIRRAQTSDIETILSIFDLARQFMRQSGNLHQWNQSYPSKELIESDIQQQISYVVISDEDEVLGTFMFKVGNDPTYDFIEGAWLNDEPYGVIHRIASNQKIKGVGRFAFDWALQQCPNLRIDTHQDNTPMRRLLNQQGFVSCGIIYLENKEPRIAFHKVSSKEKS